MRKLKKDMTGLRYGRLTVLEMLPNYQNKHKVYCRCMCDCGQEVIKRADHIEKAQCASCGCVPSHPQIVPAARKDYVGQKFGHLTVVEMLYGYGSSRESYCRCICDCGNERIISSYKLRTRKTPPSCGCMDKYYREKQADNARKDYTGLRFGRLVVDHMKYTRNQTTYAHCICDCGNEVDVRATELTRKDGKATQSCGCLQSERTSEANHIDFTNKVFQNGVKVLRPHHQTDRGVWEWVCQCPICGKEFNAIPARISCNHVTSCGCEKISSGERIVANILSNMEIEFETEYTFSECKDVRALPFDFYIPKYNTVIEYNGRQHYCPIEYFGGEEQFVKQTLHDSLKRDYCTKNNIIYIEIPYYYSYDEITETLQTSFIRRDCNG